MQKERDLELNDFKRLMETTFGRRIMYRMLVKAGIYTSSYSVEAPQHHIYFREGARNFGLWILGEVQQSSPSLYITMLEENKNE